MVHIRKTTLPCDLYNGTPSAPAITSTGGVAGHYTYKIVGITALGNHTPASSGTAITNGPTTLDGTHYNTVDPTGNTDPGAAFYDVYRTAGGVTQGKIGRIPADGATTLDDTALVADASTAPVTNTTGLGPAYQVNHFEKSSVYLAGTLTGTVQLQLSIDSGATWIDEGSALTGAGVVDITRLADQLRAKMTAFTSGTFNLNVRGLDRG